jgi:hypothetical protein
MIDSVDVWSDLTHFAMSTVDIRIEQSFASSVNGLRHLELESVELSPV